ncbi:MAG: hypothetical protein Q9226_009360, partial [Calogaya cf. arnoldii]
RALAYTIHPSITLPSAPLIADIASGTALRLLDASTQHPSGTLHGYDINLTQAPPPAWLPTNISLREWDLLSGDVEPSMTSTYDYVHTRLLVCVVQNQDPVPIIKKIWKMLKPGGWLQWDELDTTHTHVFKISPSLATPALDALASWSQANGRHDWTVRLPSFLADQGFTEPNIEYNEESSELARAFNEQHLLNGGRMGGRVGEAWE